MNNPELESRLLKEIASSGFPLELDVVAELREAEYLVSPNLSYKSVEGRAREVDAVAHSSADETDGWPFGVVGDMLVVECKRQPEKPWVFFEEVLDPSALLGLVNEVEVLTELWYQDGLNVLAACMNSPLGGHHFNAHLPRARTYFEAFSKPGRESVIYKAVQSIWHSLTFARSWFEEASSQTGGRLEDSKRRTFLLQGVIVLDGPLVLASRTEDGFALSEPDHIVLRTTDRVTREPQSAFGFGEEILIDIVSHRSFEHYLARCSENVRLLSRHLTAQLEAGWIINNGVSAT